MPNMSVGGLASGLDTATIISQLMQLEARPQTMLKSKVSNEQKVVTALQALNTKLASIASKAADLAKSSGWNPTKATSDNDKVAVTTSTGTTGTAGVGSVSFQVVSVAAAYSASYTTTAPVAQQVLPANSTFQISYDDGRAGKVDLQTGDGSLSAIAKALNSSGTGVTATLVKVDDTNYRLQVRSATTGEASGFTLTEADGTTPLLGGVYGSTNGADAEIKIAGETSGITSSTNTFAGLMPGVDITLNAGATGSATITVEQDLASLTESVKSMVESVNGVLSEIGTLTSYDAASKKAGLLGNDSTLRSVRNQLVESVSRGLGGESLSGVGIQVDRYGKLTFDEAKFKSAYIADPSGTVAKFVGTDGTPTKDTDPYDAAYGFADRIQKLGESFSSSTVGTITKSIQSRQSAIKGMEDDIADWDIRLETRRTTLQRQYTALETALGKLQSQSSWLAGQIGSLPKMSSQ
jgi:flagellar hook-associated protein 2